VVPKVWNGTQPDLLVSGPNEGGNLGPFLYTLSGTIGATYAAVERGLPAIAFSAGNSTHRSFLNVTGSNDVATLNAQASVKIVNQLANSVKSGRLLPYGYGINVNLPLLNTTCSSPSYTISRLTGGAIVDKAVLNTTTNVFTYGNDVNDPGVNACINGNCSLPGETNVVLGCSVALSVFTIDYDAPTCGNSVSNVQQYFQSLVANANATTGQGSGNGTGNGTATGSPTATSNPAQVSTNAATVIAPQSFIAFLGLAAFFML
jgi:5'-nucleotidase